MDIRQACSRAFLPGPDPSKGRRMEEYRPDQSLSAFFTTSTSHVELAITPDVTLPMRNFFMPLLPCVPMTIRSAFFAWAIFTRVSDGSPSQTIDSRFMPEAEETSSLA